MAKKTVKSKYFFNLDVYEDDGDKYFKIKYAKFDDLDKLISILKEKFR